jgi:rubrerythrin
MADANVEEILDFAIEREQEAHDFYVELAGKMDRPDMKQIFNQFAQEELGHKAKLQGVKEGKKLLSKPGKVLDLKIAEYLVKPDTEGDLDYQQALILAMQKEKAAFRLYSDIAKNTDNEEMKQLFLALAQEEAKHKLRFEVEYDEKILVEN